MKTKTKILTKILSLFFLASIISMLGVPGSAATLISSQAGNIFSSGTITLSGQASMLVFNSDSDKQLDFDIREGEGTSYAYVTLTSGSFSLNSATTYRFEFDWKFDGQLQEDSGVVYLSFEYRIRGVVVQTFEYTVDKNWFNQAIEHSFTESLTSGTADASVKIRGQVTDGGGSNYLDFLGSDELLLDHFTAWCISSCGE